MTSVRTLCTRAILLKKGRLEADGPAAEIVDRYLEEGVIQTGIVGRTPHDGTGRLRVTALQFEAPDGGRIEELPVGAPAIIRITYRATDIKKTDTIAVGVGVVGSSEGIFNNYSNYAGIYFRDIPTEGAFIFRWPSVDLVPGHYSLDIRVVANGDHHTGELLDGPPALAFSVGAADFHGSGRNTGLNFGTFLVRGDWSLESSQT